ncbi:MAG: response regulator transcription factor [Acholeplasmatales bacterium]|nr:response regulator transcription factor [Acholeplasmatales bacterium]
MRILIVDDETKIQLVLKEYASFEGYEADLASNGMDAIEMAKKNDYDLIIMDVMMPGLDGFSAVKEIKKEKDVPVLMLSARSEEYDKLHGFEIGIDDYVTKPFSPKEVMLRVNAITRRNKKKNDLRKYNGLVIDMPGRNVYVDDKKIELTPREYELLFYLVTNEGIVVTREQLLSRVWGYDYFGDDRTVDTHIKMLRNNLGPYRDYIVTARGLGYKFEPEKK